MRADNSLFGTDNIDGSKQPRYVVSIDFDGTLQHITSHDDIANVPTALAVIQNAILGISATSQTLNPDRANATIGSMSFDIVDLANAFTNVVRTQLDTNDIGLRGRTVKFYVGYKSEQDGAGILDGGSTDDNPDFDNFVLFQTQIVQSVETKEGKYSIKCADIQRETKIQIFELALTYLTSSITDTDTTIAVLDLSGFEGNVHGTSYTDAPSLDVIYIRLDSTKEIIRCPTSGISGNSFTGVTRGVLGTIAKAVEVDPASLSDRRPKVEEYVYLELPAVKLAYAILTGVIEGTANVLPSSWHAGVSTSFVRLTDFKTIGDDLWVPTDDTAAVVLRFDGIDKQDAKRFLETEIYLLLGLFSPVYADGQLGLKRMVPSLSDSPYQFEVNDSNVTGSSNLRHDMESMQNNLRVDWNWNGDRFIRSNIIVDSASITKHGQAPEKRMSFRGLVGTRFTEQVLRQLLTSLRDMYTGPPLRLDINGFHLMNPLEVGDAVRVNLSNIRDYSQAGSNLVRTMVVHGMTVDWLKGVKLKLFGSSERADEIPPITATTCLPDAFYPQAGTALSSVPGLMTGDVTNAGSFTLVGDPDMNAAGAIFYHDAPLTISSTTTLNIEDNVQLRVRGFLTIDGSIIGTGQGLAAGTDNFVFDEHYFFTSGINFGTEGFIGNSGSHFGLLFREPDDGGIPKWVWVTAPYSQTGRFDAFPNLVLEVDDAGSGSIIGIPTDMRGGGGPAGPRAGLKIGISGRSHQKNIGGAGGAGGAALVVVCRGGDFGVSGVIRLDGDDALEPTGFFVTNPNPTFHIYGGAGGAGCPGALLWLIDGSAQTFPDIAGHFFAVTGDVPAQFALPLQGEGQSASSQNRSLSQTNAPQKVMAPFMPFFRISGFDQSGVNFRISFLPCDVVPEDDQDEILQPPTAPSITALSQGIVLQWTNPPAGTFHHIEIHRSEDNVRGNALLHGTSSADSFADIHLEQATRYYYWLRTVDADLNVSVFEPDLTTTTLHAVALTGSGNLLFDPDFDLSSSLPIDPVTIPVFIDESYETPWLVAMLDQGLPSTTRDSSAVLNTNGVGGSNAVLIKKGDPASSPFRSNITLTAMRRIRSNSGRFRVHFRYRTNSGSVPFGDSAAGQSLTLYMRGYQVEEGGSITGISDPADNGNLIFPASLTYTEKVFEFEPSTTPEGGRYWQLFIISLDVTGALEEIEFDSIFAYALDETMQGADGTNAGKIGLVPAPAATDNVNFLKGDGTYAAVGGGATAFNDLTDVDLTGALDDDMLFRSGGNWIDTAGLLTWDGLSFNISGDVGLRDNDEVQWGNLAGGDARMFWSGSAFVLNLASNNSTWEIRDGTTIRLFDETDTNFLDIDYEAGAGVLQTNVGPIIINDASGAAFRTQDDSASGATSGGLITDGNGNLQQIGFNEYPIFERDVNDSFDRAHVGHLWHRDAGTSINYTCANDGTIPNGSFWRAMNEGADALTIVEGTDVIIRLLKAEGTPVTGNVSVAIGGIVTVFKYTNTEYWVWHDNQPPLVSVAFNDLTDVNLAGAANDDLLFRSGGDWIDTAGLLTWNGSLFDVSGDIGLRDNDEVQWGNLSGGDATMFWSGSVFVTHGASNNWTWEIRDGATLKLFEETDTNFMEFDYEAGLGIINANVGPVQLSHQSNPAVRTQDGGASDAITNALIRWRNTTFYDIGLAVMPAVTKSSALTISELHIHKRIRITNVTGSITFANDSGMRVDSAGWIVNTTTSNQVLAATSNNLEVFSGDGVANNTGNMILAGKGWCTWAKLSDTEYELVGVGLSSQ